jgi:DNA-binding GntR family transcriptional regulator
LAVVKGGGDLATGVKAQDDTGLPEPGLQEEALPLSFHVDRKRPVGDQIYQVLKDGIVTVRLLPGTSLSENRICRHFGVSRTPARSALLRLAEEGLIDIYPQQGSFVAPIRLTSIEDSRFIRRSLELSVLREAAQRWTPEMSAASRAILASQQRAMEQGDFDLFHREDGRFHHAFAVFAGREGVWTTIAGAMTDLGRFLRLFGIPERLAQVIAEHTAILDALEAGQAEEAARRLEYHLDKVFTMLRQVPEPYRPYVTD